MKVEQYILATSGKLQGQDSLNKHRSSGSSVVIFISVFDLQWQRCLPKNKWQCRSNTILNPQFIHIAHWNEREPDD